MKTEDFQEMASKIVFRYLLSIKNEKKLFP